MRSRGRLRPLASAVGVGLVLLAGCGGETGDATDDPTSPATSGTASEPTEPTGTAEPTTAPTTEPTTEPTEPTEPTDAPTSPPKGLRAALLTADTLPAPGDVVWDPATTRRGTGPDDVSICQVVELKSLGVTHGVTSRFQSGSVSATHVVAQFVDELGATQGYAVLEAWLSRCANQARAQGFTQTEAPTGYTPVNVGDRSGRALIFYGPVPDEPDVAYIETQSLVRVGDTLSWVVWEQMGQDYNYEQGQSPPELAIPLMAEALSGS